MDLSTFSKDTLINMIEDQQKLIHQQQKIIKSYKPTTEASNITDLTTYEIYNEDTKQMETIDKEEVFNYGSGPIRYKKGDKYYHGLGPMENRLSWYREFPDIYYKAIIEYRSKEHCLPYIEWDTHNAQEFCCHCECDIIETSKKRVYNHYICKGHTV